jgi:hypothetical protein
VDALTAAPETDTMSGWEFVGALIALFLVIAWVAALWTAIGQALDPTHRPPERWVALATAWSLVLAPVVVLKQGGWWP